MPNHSIVGSLSSRSEPTLRAHAASTADYALFFAAWKKGVLLAGIGLFGSGTQTGFEGALTKSALRPNIARITSVVEQMTRIEGKFLATLVSVCDPHEGSKLMKRVGVEGLADLLELDPQRRAILA